MLKVEGECYVMTEPRIVREVYGRESELRFYVSNPFQKHERIEVRSGNDLIYKWYDELVILDRLYIHGILHAMERDRDKNNIAKWSKCYIEMIDMRIMEKNYNRNKVQDISVKRRFIGM